MHLIWLTITVSLLSIRINNYATDSYKPMDYCKSLVKVKLQADSIWPRPGSYLSPTCHLSPTRYHVVCIPMILLPLYVFKRSTWKRVIHNLRTKFGKVDKEIIKILLQSFKYSDSQISCFAHTFFCWFFKPIKCQ